MMRIRPPWTALCASLMLAISISPPSAAQVRPGAHIRLQDQLETGLRPGRPRDKEFIRHVAALTDSGRLPRPLVDSTFQWARKKPRYQVQYFEQALRLRARRLGIEL